MKFLALGKDTIINVGAIAQAKYVDKGNAGTKLELTFISGVRDKFLGDDARKLWSALQKAASEQ